MSEENLGEVLDEGYLKYQRKVAIENLGDRTHLSLGQLAKLCTHPKYGDVVSTITLDELMAKKLEEMKSELEPEGADELETEEEPAAEAPPKKKAAAAKKTSSKKATKKAPAAKKKAAAKKTSSKKAPAAKKAAAKKTSSKKTTKSGDGKADKGKPKPRLNYDVGMKEVLAALKASKEPLGRSAIEEATGFTGVQIRAFAKKLAADGKIKILGSGGRSTKYEAA